MWSHQRFGIHPDFVTIGKPSGNGQPVAALITRREIADRFVEKEARVGRRPRGRPLSSAALRRRSGAAALRQLAGLLAG